MIRKMKAEDWGRVAEIFMQGIESGCSTFVTECPTYEEWDSAHMKQCRLVYEENGVVLGWVALTPMSTKPAYSGAVELSVYVDAGSKRRGIGTALMNAVKEAAEECGIWSFFSIIFAINTPSIELHKRCGFREIGYRERAARDKFGEWQNTVLMEYRF